VLNALRRREIGIGVATIIKNWSILPKDEYALYMRTHTHYGNLANLID
jgi:hypothetical protein